MYDKIIVDDGEDDDNNDRDDGDENSTLDWGGGARVVPYNWQLAWLYTLPVSMICFV